MKNDFDGRVLGFVCTPQAIADVMLSLRTNHGRTLDPACGHSKGVFEPSIPDIVGVELSADRGGSGAVITDFMSYPLTERFDTIIGNPPYVKAADIFSATKALFEPGTLDGRANLYLHFIEKCVRHLLPGGELIFINPREFLQATSSARLNTWILSQGAITHLIDLGEAPVFPDAAPSCVIWRFEKGTAQGALSFSSGVPPKWVAKNVIDSRGALFPVSQPHPLRLSDFASVKVGAVSGADTIYTHPDGEAFVVSTTAVSGGTRRMLTCQHPWLLAHKPQLMQRRIRRFDEDNWWQWGRQCPRTTAVRVYVNVKTRNPRPFFTHPCGLFDGSVLAVFPRTTGDVDAFCAALNAVDWAGLGFMCGGRYLFNQRSLENAPLPAEFVENLLHKKRICGSLSSPKPDQKRNHHALPRNHEETEQASTARRTLSACEVVSTAREMGAAVESQRPSVFFLGGGGKSRDQPRESRDRPPGARR